MYRRLMQSCGTLAGLLIAAMVLLVCYDVAARNFGFRSLVWVVEVTEYALPLATFLAAPWLLYRHEHVRMDVFQNTLSAANQRRIDRFAALLSLAVSAVICWYAVAVMVDARGIGAVVIKSLVFPEWWLFMPMLLSFALLGVESVRRLFLREVSRPRD